MSSPRPPYRRPRSSKAIGASLYAPLVKAIANGLYQLLAALGNATAKIIRAARRRSEGDDKCATLPDS